jgi:zinc protease
MARGPSIFFLSAVPRAGKTVAELEQALRSEIEKITKDGVTQEELARVKGTGHVAGHVYQRDSIFSQAMQTGDGWKAPDCPTATSTPSWKS